MPPAATSCPTCGTPSPQASDAATILSSDAATILSSDEATVLASDRLPSAPRDTVAAGLTLADATVTSAVPDPSQRRVPPARTSGDGPLEIGQLFGTRYQIIHQLGAGGMGAVYQAWDRELSLVVALKVIRPEVMTDPRAAADLERRFKRELLLARKVTHKNVIRIFDLGEIEGIKYITMSFVEGMDLDTILRRDGPIPVDRSLQIIRGIVSGLMAAHQADIVHRDLKPANIMIEAGTDDALIMDFGIARSGAVPGLAASGDGSTTVAAMAPGGTGEPTMGGAVVGTVAYMAPEQATRGSVDQRADLYALGLIWYDMLLGRRRHERADSPLGELQQRLQEAPEAPRTVDPAIPEAVSTLIARCLEPDPAKRIQTTSDLGAELDRLDDHGEPLPVRRVVGLPLLAAVVVLLLALSVGTWWYFQQLIPDAPHDPVSVVVADVQNGTGDPTFDGTLEPMIRRALEGAEFISAYDRRGVGIFGVRPPATLDGVAARELAVNQGVGVVLTSSIAPSGNGYEISMSAIETVTGNEIATARRRASGKDDVVQTATSLVTGVRRALGEDASESAQMFAMGSLTATSLDVVAHYAAAQEAASRSDFEEAVRRATRAVELDPEFGIGYQLLATYSRNLGRVQDARRYIDEALRYLDGMTERERFVTRGFFYRMTGDYQECVNEYGKLIERFAADVGGHNQRALCLSKLRDLQGAMDGMRHVVDLLPNQVIFRDNLALYSNYAGQFEAAEQEVRQIEQPDAYATLALAMAEIGQGRLAEARETYDALAGMGALGATLANSGLADLAALEGRFDDAVALLEEGAAADLASGNPDRAAAKLIAQAHVEQIRGSANEAIAAAEAALAQSQTVKIRFLAARIFIGAGDPDRSVVLTTALAQAFEAEPLAYAKILEGEAALHGGDPRRAVTLLTEANEILDTWIGRFDLGRAYLEAGALPQADSQFDQCLARRGEVLSLFLDEEPTYAYLPPVYYYQGLVREQLNTAGFAESYRRYLDLREASGEDPLVDEVRRRAGV